MLREYGVGTWHRVCGVGDSCAVLGQMVINVAAEQVSKAGTAAGSIVIPVPSIYYGRLTLSVVNWTQRKHVELRR